MTETGEEIWKQLYHYKDYEISSRNNYRNVSGEILEFKHNQDKVGTYFVVLKFGVIDGKERFLNIDIERAYKDHFPSGVEIIPSLIKASKQDVIIEKLKRKPIMNWNGNLFSADGTLKPKS